MKPKKVMLVFGTRPEAIKMAPIILAMQEAKDRYEPYVLATGQHDEMMNQVLDVFQINPNLDLEIMTEGQTMVDVTTRALAGVYEVLNRVHPDLVLVQGDTTTAFVSALAAYYQKIPVGHVEAGLRTHDKYSPYPEEMNRRMISSLADLHFAPTNRSHRKLCSEGISEDHIFVTGNTVIDALFIAVQKGVNFENKLLKSLDYQHKKVIVLTLHRRESFGGPIENILKAVRQIASDYQDVEIVFPVHPNPAVRQAVIKILGGKRNSNIHLLDPLGYLDFVRLMKRSYLILTDSGGIQEEAPSLAKPVLVLRETTERPEGIEAGCAKLVATDFSRIVEEVKELIENPNFYEAMAKSKNPYGDGEATMRILGILDRYFQVKDNHSVMGRKVDKGIRFDRVRKGI